VWRKWVKATDMYKIDVMMLCGDLTGKMLVPLVKQEGGYFTDYFGTDKVLKGEEEIKNIERILEGSGAYSFRTTWDQVKELQNDPKKVERMTNDAIKRRMADWLDILVSGVDTRKIKALVMPGNDDVHEVDEVIRSYEDRGILYPLDKVVEVDGFQIVSYDHVNPTPWDTPREASEGEIAKAVEEQISKLSNIKKSIFNFHCPPYDTQLDLAPELDKNLRPVMRTGQPSMIHVGSKSIRESLLKHKPMLGLHGHIHESSGAVNLDGVPIFNPGSEYGEGVLRGFVVELSKEGVEKYWRVEG
jgi:Icc-related predicted phosphoesterase